MLEWLGVEVVFEETGVVAMIHRGYTRNWGLGCWRWLRLRICRRRVDGDLPRLNINIKTGVMVQGEMLFSGRGKCSVEWAPVP